MSLLHLLAANSKLVENFEPSSEHTMKICLQIFAASMRVISAMAGDPPLSVRRVIRERNDTLESSTSCQFFWYLLLSWSETKSLRILICKSFFPMVMI